MIKELLRNQKRRAISHHITATAENRPSRAYSMTSFPPPCQKPLGLGPVRATLVEAMLGDVRTVDRQLLTRRCVSCGYDAAVINRTQTRRCPRCGCDLTQRPPRSYAEMEGLLGRPMPAREPEVHRLRAERSHREQLVDRWLVFLFLATLGLMGIVYLSAAAMAI